MTLSDIAGRTPVVGPDDTRLWVEGVRAERYNAGKGLLVKPSVLIRFATDTNYIRSETMRLYSDVPREDARSQAIMNLGLPGMRVPGVLNWQVNESSDQITNAASFEILNCLPVSRTSSTLATSLLARHHNPVIKSSFVANSLFVVDRLNTPGNVEYLEDRTGYGYKENNVKYRIFEHEQFTLNDASDFPNPATPNDAENDIPDDKEYEVSDTGSGSYFLLIDNEVIRVCRKSNNTLYIPPGGRAINGRLEAHSVGAIVYLLGYAPYTGRWTALGYLNTDDFKPQKSILRPGTCLVSYEGYGEITGLLDHATTDRSKNHAFTGYWFVSGTEPSIGEDGVPRVRVDLKSTGWMYDAHQTSPDMLQRMKTQFGQWLVGQREANAKGESIWAAADHTRDVPGDWTDFHRWDPTLPDSYPLAIKTHWAQHKEYFDHMKDSVQGKNCIYCRAELAEFLKTNKPGGIEELRHIGRHVYRQSIRVLDPIRTYIRLIATIAAAAWDHPAYGTEASYRFTKIPNHLYDNIRNVHTGLVYDGQTDIDLEKTTPGFKWDVPTYDDNDVVQDYKQLTCPFESTYDKAPFSQPMMDLAEINDMQFSVHREGYPIFVPKLWSFRPPDGIPNQAIGWRDLAKTVPFHSENSEWFMCYGASISSYSHSIEASDVMTQCWVTATTAFESEFTIASGGTGVVGQRRINFSPLGGNREGLALTGGIQQVDTVGLDNLRLGLDWNTEPAGWGVQEQRGADGIVVQGKPPLYDGRVAKGDKGANVVKVQRTVNFFLERRYINPIPVGDLYHYMLETDGVYGEATQEGVKAVQLYALHRTTKEERDSLGTMAIDGNWDRRTHDYVKLVIDKYKEFYQTDIVWYVHNGRLWEEYVAAVTGVPVPMKSIKKEIKTTDKRVLTVPSWTPVNAELLKEIDKWQRGYAKNAINSGNKKVDDSVNKASVRSITSNLADPRVIPGDVLWCEIPGYLGARDSSDRMTTPFTNGIFVTSITRQMDLTTGTYSATYSGHRYRGELGYGLSRNTSKGFEFLTK